ncbi:hypothetical protein M9458_007760, partial [Cirrhinus mrigala]
ILRHPKIQQLSTQITMDPASRLIQLRQGNRPVVQYVMDFCELCHQVDFNDTFLLDIFRFGLDKSISRFLPRSTSHWTLESYIDLALRLSGSPFTVGIADEGPRNPAVTTTPQPAHVTSPAPKPAHVMPAKPRSANVTPAKPQPAHATSAKPQPAHAMPAAPGPAHAIPTCPESAPVLAALLQPAHKMAAIPEPVHKMAAIPEPVHKMAAIPEPVHKMAAIPRPVHKMAAIPRPVHKMAAIPKPWLDCSCGSD